MNDPRPKPWPWYPNGEVLGTIINRADAAAVGLYCFVRLYPNARRVYALDARGKAQGGALYRYEFQLEKIWGETKVSWLVGSEGNSTYANRIPKRPTEGKMRLFGSEEVEERIWVAHHRAGIVRAVERLDDQFLLAKIGTMAGWKVPS